MVDLLLQICNRPVTPVIPGWSELGSSSELLSLDELLGDIPRQQVVEFADAVIGNLLDDET